MGYWGTCPFPSTFNCLIFLVTSEPHKLWHRTLYGCIPPKNIQAYSFVTVHCLNFIIFWCVIPWNYYFLVLYPSLHQVPATPLQSIHQSKQMYLLGLYLISKCLHAVGRNHVTWRTLNRNIALTRHYCLHEYSWQSGIISPTCPWPGLLTYWPSWLLTEPAIQPTCRPMLVYLGFSLAGSKVYRGWAPSQRTSVMRNLLLLLLLLASPVRSVRSLGTKHLFGYG